MNASESTLLDTMVAVWRRERGASIAPPASEQHFASIENKLCAPLPPDVRSLYARMNGGSVLGGNLALHPLDGRGSFTVAAASNALRADGWPIPPELVVFGGNGQGDQYGWWNDGRTRTESVVVELGQIFEPGCMAIVGTSLNRFLLSLSAYHLQHEPSVAGLDQLAVPASVRSDPDDETLAKVFAWADPGLPRIPPDPYADLMDRAAVNALVSTLA